VSARQVLIQALLSTIGSRGDVQPLVPLAWQLKSLGQEVRLCVPPDFREWIEGLGMPVTPMGPELRPTGKAKPSAAPPVGDSPAPAAVGYTKLWDDDARRWNNTWGPLLNSKPVALGLAPLSDVRSYVLTARPCLAADPTLAPWPDAAHQAVLQTGAWLLPDERPHGLAPATDSAGDIRASASDAKKAPNTTSDHNPRQPVISVNAASRENGGR